MDGVLLRGYYPGPGAVVMAPKKAVYRHAVCHAANRAVVVLTDRYRNQTYESLNPACKNGEVLIDRFGRTPVFQCDKTNVRYTLEAALLVALRRPAAVGREHAFAEGET